MAKKRTSKRRKASGASKEPPGAGAPPPVSNEAFVPDPADRELAMRALRKRQSGEEPTAREAAALQRESIRRNVRAIPQKLWREMSGRQARTINEQAERYGLPFGGATVDLYALVPALHNFLATNKHRLAAPVDDPMMTGESSPALERYRDERAKIARLERLEREGTLVAREALHEGWQLVSGVLRQAGETLQRQFGSEAHAILEEALDEADRHVARTLGGAADGEAA